MDKTLFVINMESMLVSHACNDLYEGYTLFVLRRVVS
jgi:hypothetical protein